MTYHRKPYLRRQRCETIAWTVAITCALVIFWIWIANSIFTILAAS